MTILKLGTVPLLATEHPQSPTWLVLPLISISIWTLHTQEQDNRPSPSPTTTTTLDYLFGNLQDLTMRWVKDDEMQSSVSCLRSNRKELGWLEEDDLYLYLHFCFCFRFRFRYSYKSILKQQQLLGMGNHHQEFIGLPYTIKNTAERTFPHMQQ